MLFFISIIIEYYFYMDCHNSVLFNSVIREIDKYIDIFDSNLIYLTISD